MGRYLGIDIGTTTITALCFSAETRAVSGVTTVANSTETTSATDRSRGRSEWDLEAMLTRATECARQAVEHCGGRLDGIGVTGQMHGMALLDPTGRPTSPFIGWQDARCLDASPDGPPYINALLDCSPDLLALTGCTPATGYMGATLHWLKRTSGLAPTTRAAFIADALVARLCGSEPVTDPTHAASAGVFDIHSSEWNTPLLEALGLSKGALPVLAPSCSRAGVLTHDCAVALGVLAGTPVAVACGDNQASFAGSVANATQTVLVNVGTGGQVSLHTDQPLPVAGMDLRPYLDNRWLIVGAELCGGSSYALLRDFFCAVVGGLGAPPVGDDLYDRMTQLAAAAPPGADGLTCIPRFAGTRSDPAAAGSISGLTQRNFSPGHLARALIEGLAADFHGLYAKMQRSGAEPAHALVGSGNGIRRNPVLQTSLERAFGLSLRVPAFTEEAALGAALVAAVSVGEFGDIAQASAHALRVRGIDG